MQTLASASLVPLAQLMAYAARADGRVTAVELETLHDFLLRRYPAAARSQFFDLFRQAVDGRPDFDAILAGVHRGLPDYPDRLEVYATVLTLLAESGLGASEGGTLGRIGSLLDVEPPDADLLANAAKPTPDFRFPLNRARWLRLALDGVEVRAADAGQPLVAMSLAGLFAVRASIELVVNDVAFPPADIVFVRPSDLVRLPAATVSFSDLGRLFDLARRRVTRRWQLRLNDARLTAAPGHDQAPFELSVRDARIRFRKRDRTHTVHLNGRPIDAEAAMVPGDILAFEAGEIRVADVLDAPDDTAWPLRSSADTPLRYVISDGPVAGPGRTLGDVGGALAITISESGAASRLLVACDGCACRAPVTLDGAALDAGARVEVAAPATLRVGPHWFAIDPRLLTVQYSTHLVDRFEVRQLEFRFGRAVGLRNISFTARAGQLVGIMGGSGTGKSTLLSVLLGMAPPEAGAITLNGVPLETQLRRRRSILGYVPQDDLVIDTLTVEENVRYAGRIRCPNLPAAELERRVAHVLHEVALFDQRRLRAGSPARKVLSGGQRKRLNIAIELVADPELFFLDEPTSGLSSQDSKAIMALLGGLTRRGKLVFTVIHQPSSDIYKMFDEVLLLDTGGVLAWYGPAGDAVRYFKAFLPEHREFVECPACGSVNPDAMLAAIGQAVPAAGTPSDEATRRFDPDFWASAFLLREGGDRAAPVEEPPVLLPRAPAMGFTGRARAFRASVERAFVDRSRDRTNIVMSVVAPAALGLSMAAMLRGPDEPYTYSGNPALAKFLFLSTIVFVFFGLMASVNEVIREVALIRRERVASFKASQYVAAKTLAFLPFSLLQVGIYVAIASVVLQFPYRAPAYVPIQPLLPFPWYAAIVLFLIVQAAFALGLLVSSYLRSPAAAFNWIPLLIIPQILLGGIFVDFADLPKLVNRDVPELAELTFSRWGYEALVAGEKAFNPSDHFNADSIIALRNDLTARGLRFDALALVEAPRARWRTTPAFTLPPPHISSTVMQGTLLHLLRLNDQTADANALESAYTQVDRRTYVLRAGLPAATTADLGRILMSPSAGWWASRFAAASVNATLESERQDANAFEPRASAVREWLTDTSEFPARVRTFGAVAVPVVWWDCLVLVAMVVVCHSASMLHLR